MYEARKCTVGVLCAGDPTYTAARFYFNEKFEDPEEVSMSDGKSYTVGRVGRQNVVLARFLEGEDITYSATVRARHMLKSFPNISYFLILGLSGFDKPIPLGARLIPEKDVEAIQSRGERGDASRDYERTLRISDVPQQAPPGLRKNGFAILNVLQKNGQTLDELVRGNQTVVKIYHQWLGIALGRRQLRVPPSISNTPAQSSDSEEDDEVKQERESGKKKGKGKREEKEEVLSLEFSGSSTGISRDETVQDSSLRSRRPPAQGSESESHLLPVPTSIPEHRSAWMGGAGFSPPIENQDALQNFGLAPMGLIVPRAPQTSVLSLIFHRSTLVAVLLLFECLSAFTIATAVQKTREPSCTPRIEAITTDDGFWVLLSQLSVLVISTYCTLYVVYTSEEMFWLDRFWFEILLLVSISAAILAVVIYPWSWKISTILGFVSGSAQVVSLGQVAASLRPLDDSLV